MTKSKKTLLIVGIVCLAVLLAVLLAFCGLMSREDASAPAGDMTYTVQVKNASDAPMEGIGVYIYEDETLTDLVWFDKTNAEGQMSFTVASSDKYVAALGNIPTGYAAEDYYPLTGELTEIILAAGVMSEEDMQSLTYELGDLMMDFTIIDTEGKEYTLSELLKTKKAVVLNFWYMTCEPCKAEFPYLQEAYEKYKDQIEVLAMNPVDMDEAAVAAFKKELGLTFPMAVVDELWAQMMKLTAYPTTVVIDRFGNITLIHKGSIDSADTFEQIFAYFTSDDYVQKNIESIDEIVTKKEGTEDNPMQTGGGQYMEVTVGAGETYYLDLYKITGKVYLTVKGTDFILGYNGKEYTPSNGSVTITITSEGPSTPVKLSITNTGKEEQTYYLYLASPKGSYSNPYSLSLGEFSINTDAGNEQGVFGTYVAEKSGTLTVRCLRSSVSRYGFYLYNLRSYAMRNADEDAKVDEDGYVTVSVQVKKGDTVQFSVAVGRDDSNYIAAGSFRFELLLTEGDGEEKGKIELPKTTYTVKVTDQDGKPMSGVTVNLKGEFTYVPTEEETEKYKDAKPEDYQVKVDEKLVTDSSGVITTEQVTGPYTATVVVPDGYKLETTQYELTGEKPSVTVKLKKIQYFDYAVTVVDPTGKPVSGVTVMIGSVYGTTNSKGVYTQNLAEGTYTASIVGGLPADLEVLSSSYSFPTGATKLTIKLGYAPGTKNNPVAVAEGYDYITTRTLDAGETRYYSVSGVDGTALIVGDADAKVTFNGTVYTADAAGVVTVNIPEGTSPALIAVTNGAAEAKKYSMQVGYLWGTEQNPVTISEKYDITTRTLAKDEQVHYSISGVSETVLTIADADAVVTFNGTEYAAVDGVVTVTIPENTEPALLTFTNKGTTAKKLNVKLTYPAGHEKNPIVMDGLYMADAAGTVDAADAVYYTLNDVAGTTLTITGADHALWNGAEYPAENGVVTVAVDSNTASGTLVVGNTGTEAKSYSVDFGFALGTRQNPEKIEDITDNTIYTIAADDQDGYYYCWSVPEEETGTHTIILYGQTRRPHYVFNTDEGIEISVSRFGKTGSEVMSVSEDKATVSVLAAAGDLLLIHVEQTKQTSLNVRFYRSNFAAGDPPEDESGEDGGTVDTSIVYVEDEDPLANVMPNEFIEPENVLPEGMLAYTVTVTDYAGSAVSGAVVQIKKGDAVAATGMTNYKGEYTANLEEGDYTVALAFATSGYHYEESTAVLSANKPSLTVKVTTALPSKGVAHTNGFEYYPVELGGTYLTLQANAIKYYAFTPTQQGTYRFEASDPNAVLSYWAAVTFPNNATESTLDRTGNGFSLSFKESNIDPNNPATYLIGITGVSDSILEITRIGDSQFDFTDLPYTVPEYEATVTLKEQDFFSQLAAGKKLTFVDLTASTNSVKPVLGNDGYYHLGSASGPILYVQLTVDKTQSEDGKVPPYIHLYDMVGGVSAERGTALRYANYDNYYVDGTYVKEDYTACMLEYGSYAAKNKYGIYPLTDDLVYMIQMGGDYQGWYEAEQTTTLFKDADGNLDTSINLEIGWMFAVCYFA